MNRDEHVPFDGFDLALFLAIALALLGAAGLFTYAFKSYESATRSGREAAHRACVASAGEEACMRGVRR